MKRLSLFCAALFAATSMFAAVTYELNEGVMGTYADAEAMYHDLNADYNAATGGTATWVWITDPTQIASGLPTQQTTWDLTFFTGAGATKWGWLGEYLDAMCTEQAKTLPSTSAAFMRYNLAAFFANTVRSSWPASADYTTCGVSTLAAYQSYWKSSFANPTEPTAEVALYAPYKEGFTFDGWYAAADFSGERVATIDATTTGTLYAKWVEYIPNTAEVKALADNATTKCKGVVNFINGKNIYIQDAKGGMLVYTSATPTCTVGQEIVVSGTKVMYGGAPEIKNATVESASDATLPTATLLTLGAFKADALKYFGMRIQVNGVRIVAYDTYSNPSVSDGFDTLKLYKVALDQTAMPLGTKISFTLVGAYYNGAQFVGDPANVEKVVIGKHDNYNYPERDGRMSLTNRWIISNNEDNFAANMPSTDGMARGMVAKDGKFYFVDRAGSRFVVVDGQSGEMLDPIAITGEHLFEIQGEDEAWSSAVTLPFNDVKLDNAGHFLIGACVSSANHFFVYKVDITTGAATEVINYDMYANEDFGADLQEATTKWRFDAFNVYGDVEGNAIIMAADANSMNAYKWTIEEGVVTGVDQIDCSLTGEETSMMVTDGAATVTSFGTAPQIFPIDNDYFYVDGFNHLPTLYDMDGGFADDFKACPTGTKVVNNEGDTLDMNFGHNGLCEFEVNGEYFLVMAARNTVAYNGCNSAFALYKFADEERAFSDMTPLWFFPNNGMGGASNGCRTAVPSVEVSGNKAIIYVYTQMNGYGVYEFTVNAAATGFENIENNAEVTKVIENGQIFIIKNGVRYSVLGAVVK